MSCDGVKLTFQWSSSIYSTVLKNRCHVPKNEVYSAIYITLSEELCPLMRIQAVLISSNAAPVNDYSIGTNKQCNCLLLSRTRPVIECQVACDKAITFYSSSICDVFLLTTNMNPGINLVR